MGTKEISSKVKKNGVTELKELDGELSQQKIDALHVLHNTGHIFLAECDEGCCICFKPQFIANIIAIFADPACFAFDHSKLRACASREIIWSLLQEHLPAQYRSVTHMNAILKFLELIRIIIEIDHADTSFPVLSGPMPLKKLFMVPSALKGRPSFWREVLPRPVTCLRGLRFRSMQKIVTVGQFLWVMAGVVRNPDRMWGCAFVVEVSAASLSTADSANAQVQAEAPPAIWIFVRLYETRDFVDAVILGASIEAVNADQASAAVFKIMKKLECDATSPLRLCPFCCASDVYVRCGAAHKFPNKGKASSHEAAGVNLGEHTTAPATSPSERLRDILYKMRSSPASAALKCSRFHTVSLETLSSGLMLDGLGKNEMPVMYPADWASGARAAAALELTTRDSVLNDSPHESSTSSTSASEQVPVVALAPSVTAELPRSSLGPKRSSSIRVRDRLPWQRVTSAGFAVVPDGSGRALSHSFFVSTRQLEVDDVVVCGSMGALHAAIDAAAGDGSNADHLHEAAVLKKSNVTTDSTYSSLDASVSSEMHVPLKLTYRVGDMIGTKTIAEIYSCSRARTVFVDPAQAPSSPSSSSSTAFTLQQPHTFSDGNAVMLCVRLLPAPRVEHHEQRSACNHHHHHHCPRHLHR